MDLLSQKIERSELKVGDHIYTWRTQIYSHHGIFIGNDMLIHFVNPRGNGILRVSAVSGSSSSSGGRKGKKTPCPTLGCGSERIAGSGVQVCCIDCFVKEGSLYRFKYEASSAFLLTKMRGGTCTTARSDSPKEVIHRTIYLYKNGYGEYDLLNNNCEDFALYCKTGLWSKDKNNQGRSSQAIMVHSTKKEYNIESFSEQLLTAIPRYFLKRENKDLGVREDVVKVPVELLSSFRLALNK